MPNRPHTSDRAAWGAGSVTISDTPSRPTPRRSDPCFCIPVSGRVARRLFPKRYAAAFVGVDMRRAFRGDAPAVHFAIRLRTSDALRLHEDGHAAAVGLTTEDALRARWPRAVLCPLNGSPGDVVRTVLVS